MTSASHRWLFAFLILGVAACAPIEGFPDRSYSRSDELAALQRYKTDTALAAFDATDSAARGGMTREGWRNTVIEARIQDTNINFSAFEKSLYEQGIGFGIGTDWIALALSAAGSVTAGAAQALAAAAAGVTGARASFDTEALYSKTLQVLMAEMAAQRQTVLVRIRQGEMQDAAAYPLTRGLADLEDYYAAGTIPGAIVNLAASAGDQAKQAQIKLDAIPLVTAVAEDVQTKKEPIAAYVKTLSQSDLDKLAGALMLPTGDGALPALLKILSTATTSQQLNDLTAAIKTLFNKDF